MRYIPLALGLLALALLACGGGAGSGPKVQDDGALYVQYVNEQLTVWMTVVSINGQVPQEKELAEGVSPQQEVEISLNEITPATAVLSGGSEILVKLRVLLDRPEIWPPAMKDFHLTVTIDGSQLLYITDMNPFEEGLDSLKYQIKPCG